MKNSKQHFVLSQTLFFLIKFIRKLHPVLSHQTQLIVNKSHVGRFIFKFFIRVGDLAPGTPEIAENRFHDLELRRSVLLEF